MSEEFTVAFSEALNFTRPWQSTNVRLRFEQAR